MIDPRIGIVVCLIGYLCVLNLVRIVNKYSKKED